MHRKDEIFQSQFNLDPLVVRQRRPNEVRFCDSRLVWTKDDLGLFVVDMQTTNQKDETREAGVLEIDFS